MDRTRLISSQVETLASDNALVRRARLGDRTAFADLFERHSRATFRYAVRMLDGDQDAAQDAVQEAWIKAWTHLEHFRGDAAFTTWMFTITAREVYTARRRRRPVPMTDEQLRARFAEAGDVDARGPGGGEAQAAADALADALTLELARLPWRQRAVWVLRELEGLSYADIASIQRTNLATVRGQLHRARRTLALRMEEWR